MKSGQEKLDRKCSHYSKDLQNEFPFRFAPAKRTLQNDILIANLGNTKHITPDVGRSRKLMKKKGECKNLRNPHLGFELESTPIRVEKTLTQLFIPKNYNT